MLPMASVLMLGIGAQWLAWRLHLPLFLMDNDGELEALTADGDWEPQVGQRLISMVDSVDANGGAGP